MYAILTTGTIKSATIFNAGNKFSFLYSVVFCIIMAIKSKIKLVIHSYTWFTGCPKTYLVKDKITTLSTNALITYTVNTAKHFFVLIMRYGKQIKNRLVIFDTIFIAGEEQRKLITLLHPHPMIYKLNICIHLLSSFCTKILTKYFSA